MASANRIMQLQIILAAQDRMSRVIQNAFGAANKAMGKSSEQVKKIGTIANSVSQVTGAVGLSMLAPLGLAANEAINFEDKMASVSKVLNLENGSKQLNKVGNEVKALGDYLAKSPTQVAELYANLAQGGAAKNELGKIAKIAGEVAVAFDIDPGIAGDRFIKLSNAMGLTTAQTKSAADAINYLSDKTAAKASQILDFFAAGGAGAARALGVTAQEAGALGAFYISMGKSGEEAATVVERMTKALRNQDKAAGRVFKGAGGGMAGVIAAIQKGASLSGQARFEYFKQFGEYGIEVEQMANNVGKLDETLGLVAKSGNYANSVTKEFANRSNTTAFRIAQAQANLQSFAIEIGTTLLPAITSFLKKITPIIRGLTAWAQANPKLVGTITKLVAVVGGAMLAISAIAKVVAVFNMVLYANPIVWLIAGVVAFAASVYLIYTNWGKISEWFKGLWTKIKSVFSGMMEWLKGVGKWFFQAGVNIVKMIWKGITWYYSLPIKAIKALVGKIREYLPFSPAKVGPLKTLHRVKIAETIASSIKTTPIKAAMERAVSPIQQQGALAFAGGSSGSSISINFAPTLNMGAGGNKESVMAGLKQYEGELMRIIKEATRKDARAQY